jgi:hypothetical protein
VPQRAESAAAWCIGQSLPQAPSAQSPEDEKPLPIHAPNRMAISSSFVGTAAPGLCQRLLPLGLTGLPFFESNF